MQDVPGVYVEAGKTGGNTISMRGLSSAYTLILIDGKRQNVAQGFDSNGFSGTFTGFMPPASMIERIEVIRGPASTLYGSDAMGGVINIITKKHSDEVNASIQLDARIAEHYKTFGHIYGLNGYVTTPLIKDTLSLNLRGGAKYGGQNRFYTPTVGRNGNPYSGHSSTGFINANGGFRLNYTPQENNFLYLDSEVYYARTGSLNTSSSQVTAIRDFYKVNTVLNHEANYDWGKLTSYVQYSFTTWAPHEGVKVGGSKGTSINFKDKARFNNDVIFQSAYNNDFDLGDYGAIIFNGGIYYMYEQLIDRSSKFNDHLNQVALFGEGEYIINDYVSTTLGLRINYSDKFNSLLVPNPRFYVAYSPTNFFTLKAGIASGVLQPNLKYLYEGYTTSSSSSTTYTYGNKKLKPETSWNYEISTIFDTSYLNFTLTAFYTDFGNQITTADDNSLSMCSNGSSSNGTCKIYRNLDKSLMTGAEVSFRLKPIYGFSLDTNYSFIYTKVLSAGANEQYLVGNPVNSIPKHSVIITPKYTWEDLDVFLRYKGNFLTPTIPTSTAARTGVRQVIGNYYKDYHLLDLSISYKFLKKTLVATFAINNLLDTNFYEPVGYSNGNGTSYQNRYQRILPSRNYWLSLRYDF